MPPADELEQAGSARVGLISDTHGYLHPKVFELFHGCDAIIHAGDICGHGVVEGLRSIAPLHAVAGNCDSPFANPGLPGFDLVTVAGAGIAIIHNIRDLDVEPVAAGVRVVVHGHTHRAEVRTSGPVLYVNPGSAGPRRFSCRRSVAILDISPSEISARIVEFDE